MTFNLQLKHDHDLLALRRTLIEGKFATDPNDRDIAGSPLIAEICETVFAAPCYGHVETIHVADYPRIVDIIRTRIVESVAENLWQPLSHDAKKQFVHALLAPYVADNDLTDELIKLGDQTVPPQRSWIDEEVTNGDEYWVSSILLDVLQRTLLLSLSPNVDPKSRDREIQFDNIDQFQQTFHPRAKEMFLGDFGGIEVESTNTTTKYRIGSRDSWITFIADEEYHVRKL